MEVNYNLSASMDKISSNKVFLGLGSNLGNRENNLVRALELLQDFGTVAKISSIYETQSILHDNQGDYLNLVCLFGTALEPLELLKSTQNIENVLGRNRSVKIWGERLIDIDLLDFNGLVYSVPDLVLPHKEMLFRSFVLYPIMEIEPEYIHPVALKNIKTLIASLSDNLEISKFKDKNEIIF